MITFVHLPKDYYYGCKDHNYCFSYQRLVTAACIRFFLINTYNVQFALVMNSISKFVSTEKQTDISPLGFEVVNLELNLIEEFNMRLMDFIESFEVKLI